MSAPASLLLREPPLVVLPSLAARIGLNEAIVLQQIHFRSTERGNTSQDGWVQRTRRAWRQEFPFWAPATIKRALANLRKLNLIDAEMVTTADGCEPRYRVRYHIVDTMEGVGSNCADPSGQSAPGGRVNVTRGRSFKRGERTTGEEKPASQSSPSSPSDENRDELLEERLRRSTHIALADRLARAMLANNPRARTSPTSRAWTEPIRLLLEQDDYDVAAIRAMIDWSQADDFERSIVLSPSALRRGAERIVQKMRRAGVPPFDDEDGAAPMPAGPRGGGPGGPGVDDLQRRLREQADAVRADVVDGSATEVSG